MLQWVLDALVPIHCVGCGCYNSWLCPDCLAAQWHPGCAHLPADIAPTIGQLLFLGEYHAPLLQRAITTMKYQSISQLATIFGLALRRWFDLESYDYIVPVPLHRRRLRERGFNQSAVMAAACNRPIIPALQRTYYTKPQASLRRHERLTNVQTAFTQTLTMSRSLAGATILLVDDVCTTGSTLQQCAAVLQNNQPKRIDAAVIAIDLLQPNNYRIE
ncbi:MAG: ComF family protein [Candidatus Kerfeldbacteria bacterium]|nr:ComF family protein [Candidatus Kerfeldbacteria bacterium]